MAFMLTRPASPLPREGPQIGADAQHGSQTMGSSSSLPDHDMGRDKDRPHLEINLDSPYIFLKGLGTDVEPAVLSGHVALHLTEPTTLKEITLQFRGKARLPSASPEPVSLNGSHLTYVVCSHDWSFLEGEKGVRHTLKAGHHIFPFQLRLGGSLPSSITSAAHGGASISYKLRAQAVRTGLSTTLQAILSVPIIRSFAPEALEYQQSLEIENTWPEKIMYSIMIPHKAWAAGDRVTALVKFSPLLKGVSVQSVTLSIQEQTKLYSRLGPQEQIRIIASSKYDTIAGKAAPVEQSGHAHHTSINGPTSSSQASGRSHFSFPPLPTTGASTPPAEPEPSTFVEDETLDLEGRCMDVVAFLDIDIPVTATPTHNLEPINVSHRVRWSILIKNPDDHTSELRCSLPLHILDPHLLEEARSLTAATRRLLFGLDEVPPEEDEDAQLPSYKSHVHDRVANMYLPDSATMRVTNPWIAQRTSPTYFPDGRPPSFWPVSQSGHSSPLEAHVYSQLPHAPGPGRNATLDWVNSELLLSLSEMPPPPLSRQSLQCHRHVDDDVPTGSGGSDSGSRPSSRRASRIISHLSSRGTSPERLQLHGNGSSGADTPASSSSSTLSSIQTPSTASSHETYVHSSHASRNVHSLLNASMKPFSSLVHPHWPRSSNLQPCSSQPDLQQLRPSQGGSGVTRTPASILLPMPDPTSGTGLLHRAFTEVPDYSIASRGFLGGVTPLSSMQGLPSYDEIVVQQREEEECGNERELLAQGPPERSSMTSPLRSSQRTQSDSDLTSKFGRLSMTPRQPGMQQRPNAAASSSQDSS